MLRQNQRKAFFRLAWMAILAFSIIGAAAASFDEFGNVLFLPFVARHLPAPTPAVYAHPLISEVVYDPVADEPGGEWIEIYNSDNTTLNLSQFKIGDAEMPGDREGMLRFPAGSSLSPQEVVVVANQASAFEITFGFKPDYEMVESDPVIPNMIKYHAWAGYNLELTDNGDEVLLLDGDDQIVDMLSWGSSAFAFDPPIPRVSPGYSLERKPADIDRDEAGDWKSQANPAPKRVDLARPTQTATSTHTPTSTLTSTPTDTPMPCGEAPLLISEVLYDPVGDLDPAGEWVEIYNPSQVSVNLACVRIGDEETPGGGEGMLVFPAGRALLPGGIIVIANQASSFVEQYSFRPEYEIVDTDPLVPDMLKDPDLATGTLNLSNAGDEILILDGTADLVDSVSWAASTFAFEPAIPGVPQGHSIERKPAFQDTNSAGDWIEQPNPQPASVDFSGPTATPTATPTRTPTAMPTPTRTPIPCEPLTLHLSEVLYDPLGDTDTGREWVEIYNPGSKPINLSCAKLGDEETSGGGEAMLVFPDNRAIKPGEAIVVASRATLFHDFYGFNPDYEIIETDLAVPNMLRDNHWGSGSFNLSNTGDDVLILDWLDRSVDAVSWGSSTFAFDPAVAAVAEGHSIARAPAGRDTNTAGDWLDQSAPDPAKPLTAAPTPTKAISPSCTSTPTLKPASTKTPTQTSTSLATSTPWSTPSSTPLPCAPYSLLLSEVLYDPVGTDTGYEWLEIFNPGTVSVNLACAKVGDEEAKGGGEAMLVFPDGRAIDPGKVVVVANRAADFSAVYGFNPDYEIIETDPTVLNMLRDNTWGTGSFNLSNTGDDVLILDWLDRPVDAVSWGTSAYAFDPAVALVTEGHSLARVPADSDTDSATDWLDHSVPRPGSVEFVVPTAEPSSTPSRTPSPTPTRTQTPTRTTTLTLMPTLTATPTKTFTPRPTFTITPSPTYTPTGTSSPSPTPTQTVALLISEVLYAPRDQYAIDEQWVEIYNPMSASIDLSNYKLGDEENRGGTEAMMRFPIGSWIGPGQAVVVASKAIYFYDKFHFLPDYEIADSMLEVPDLLPYVSWSGGSFVLYAESDEVILLDPNDALADVVTFGESLHPACQPAVPGVLPGHSIERRPADQDTNSNADWIDQANPNPGSVYMTSDPMLLRAKVVFDHQDDLPKKTCEGF